jgi:4-alpha-glucanotransferase
MSQASQKPIDPDANPHARRLPRGSGLVAHISSLAGDLGTGDFGPVAFEFVDYLQRCGQTIWQMLPLGPTGYGNSPYQSPSAFAGNPLYISLQHLVTEGLLDASDLHVDPPFAVDTVDFERVGPWRHERLLKAAHRHAAHPTQAPPTFRQAYSRFRHEQAAWLDDYALFIALKESHGNVAWPHWDPAYVRRDLAALAEARQRLAPRIEAECFIQFEFSRQWRELKKYANERNVRLVGDMPIFVAHDSADVWANQHLFPLTAEGKPTVVAGVPPDYFSEIGQLWGNPLYKWDLLAERGYDWWIDRFRYAFSVFDLVRIDHFRGFEAYWEIPGDAVDARTGRWVKGPGISLFRAAEKALGPLPIIAEDLGVITKEVDNLRDELGAPGMRVLQFAFGDDDKANEYQPHNYPHHCLVYTGTHDNDTTVGWFRSEAGEGTTRNEEQIQRERHNARVYMRTHGDEIHWDMIRLAWSSVADTAIAPLQDILGLGTEARMNLPGTLGGNWRWRVLPSQLTPQIADRLRHLTEEYGRIGQHQPL